MSQKSKNWKYLIDATLLNHSLIKFVSIAVLYFTMSQNKYANSLEVFCLSNYPARFSGGGFGRFSHWRRHATKPSGRACTPTSRVSNAYAWKPNPRRTKPPRPVTRWPPPPSAARSAVKAVPPLAPVARARPILPLSRCNACRLQQFSARRRRDCILSVKQYIVYATRACALDLTTTIQKILHRAHTTIQYYIAAGVCSSAFPQK